MLPVLLLLVLLLLKHREAHEEDRAIVVLCSEKAERSGAANTNDMVTTEKSFLMLPTERTIATIDMYIGARKKDWSDALICREVKGHCFRLIDS